MGRGSCPERGAHLFLVSGSICRPLQEEYLSSPDLDNLVCRDGHRIPEVGRGWPKRDKGRGTGLNEERWKTGRALKFPAPFSCFPVFLIDPSGSLRPLRPWRERFVLATRPSSARMAPVEMFSRQGRQARQVESALIPPHPSLSFASFARLCGYCFRFVTTAHDFSQSLESLLVQL